MSNIEVHQLVVKSFNPRAGDLDYTRILPRNYIYNYYIWNLKRPYINQIFLDLKKKIYGIDMLSRIICSGQLDSFGCSSVEGMKKMRFCEPDHGFKILN
jgi:hypothetical protein